MGAHLMLRVATKALCFGGMALQVASTPAWSQQPQEGPPPDEAREEQIIAQEKIEILNPIDSVTFPPPAPREHRPLPAVNVLSARERALSKGRKLRTRWIEPVETRYGPPPKQKPSPNQFPASNLTAEELARLLKDPANRERQLHFSATVFDEAVSLVSWRHHGTEYSCWSNVHWGHLAAVSRFKIEDRRFSLWLDWRVRRSENIGEDDWHGHPPDLPGEPPQFEPIGGEMPAEALEPLIIMHKVYARMGNRLAEVYETQQRSGVAWVEWRIANPPRPEDIDVLLWPNSSVNLYTYHWYDRNGNETLHQDPLGHRTRFAYDSRNRLKTITYEGAGNPNTVKNLYYDGNGNKIAEKDERGHRSVYVYDELNRLIAEGRDMDGDADNGNGTFTLEARGIDLRTDYTYNDVGSILTAEDPRGNITTHTYDEAQRRTSTTVPLNGSESALTQFFYESRYTAAERNDGQSDLSSTSRNPGSSVFNRDGWKPTRIVDPRGYETLMANDGRFREIHRKASYDLAAASYAETTTLYDDESRIVTKIDPLGKISEEERDILGRVIKTIVAKGPTSDQAITQHVHTSTGFLWKTTDAEGRETQFKWDPAGRQTEIIQLDADGTGSPTTVTAYDKNGNVVSVTDPEGNVTLYVYDKRDWRTAEIGAAVTDAVTGTTYHPATLTVYDEAGNVVQVIDRRGLNDPVVTGTVSVTAAANAADYSTVTSYDAANRPTHVTSPSVAVYGGTASTSQTITEYDDNGNPVKVTDGEGNITHNTYDVANRLVATTTNPTSNQSDPNHASAITVNHLYDKAGNLKQVTDGKGQVTTFTFDGFNRTTLTCFDPNDTRKERTKFVYDALNLVERQVLSGTGSVLQRTSYAHDDQHRLKTVTYHGSEADNRHYDYDKVGNIQAVEIGETNSPSDVDALRSAYYTHDALNRVKTETSADVTHDYDYDKVGNRTGVTYGGTYGRTLTSVYDALNRLESCTEGTGRQVIFGYDRVGNLHERTYPNTVEEIRDHDARNRLVTLTTQKSNGTDLAVYSQQYDQMGNVRQIVETHGSSVPNRTLTLSYDHIYRLTSEAVLRSGNTQTTTFTYDDAHNRTQKVVSGSGPADTGTWDYIYGATGGGNNRNSNQLYQVKKDSSLISTLNYDDKGNLVTRTEGGKTLWYYYDHENRLTKATLPNNYVVPDGTTLPGQRHYEFQYDYRTRRVFRDERSTTPGNTTFYETTVSFSGGLGVQEYTASGDHQAHYIRGSDFGGGIGGILFSMRGSGGSPNPSYYHYNSRGDVTTKSDDYASTTWQTAYQSHGEHLAADTSGIDSDPHRTNTKEESGDLRLVNDHFRLRFLNLGIYLQRDPAGFVDGPNVYTYVRQNPWTFWDPLGLETKSQLEGMRDRLDNAYKKQVADINAMTGISDKERAAGLDRLAGVYERQRNAYTERINKLGKTARDIAKVTGREVAAVELDLNDSDTSTAKLIARLEHAESVGARDAVVDAMKGSYGGALKSLATGIAVDRMLRRIPGVKNIYNRNQIHASYTPPPKVPSAFPKLKIAKRKTTVQGGGGLRKRWKDKDGNIYEWDSQHGTVEKFNKRGRHLGEFDSTTGDQLKPADPTRRVDP